MCDQLSDELLVDRDGARNNSELSIRWQRRICIREGHVRWAGAPEETPCTPNCVDSALAVHKRMLSVPAIRAVLLNADERDMPNPLDSIVKVQAIASKADTETNILWTVTLLLDFY